MNYQKKRKKKQQQQNDRKIIELKSLYLIN